MSTNRSHPAKVAAGVSAACTLLLVFIPGRAWGEVWDADNVKFSPQVQYDIDQGRPRLAPSRPEVDAINIHGDMTGYGWNGFNPPSDPNDWDDPNYGYNYNRPYFYNRTTGTIANLGDLSGHFGDPNDPNGFGTSRGRGVNDLGWVVGDAIDANGVTKPFIWIDDDGNGARTMTPTDEMREIALNPEDPNDPNAGPATWGRAMVVSNSGYVLVSGSTGTFRAQFEYDPNTHLLTEIGPRVYVSTSVEGYNHHMNEQGDVAWGGGSAGGYVWKDLNDNDVVEPNEICRSAVFHPAPMVGSPSSVVAGINNAGQVCGYSSNWLGKEVGWLWTDLNGNHRFDWDDTNGDGYFQTDETSDEIQRWTGDGSPIDATIGNTFVRAINQLGQAVGGFAYSSSRFAWVWDPVAGPRYLDDLVDPGFEVQIRQAEATNHKGQIGCFGRITGSNNEYLVLVTPPLYALTITKKNGHMGDVELSPEPYDVNAPAYPADLGVTLTGVPLANKSFKQWEIFDPNHPGDDNYSVIDSNNPILIVMMADRQVEAAFKCGSSVGEVLPLLMVGVGVCGWLAWRRR